MATTLGQLASYPRLTSSSLVSQPLRRSTAEEKRGSKLTSGWVSICDVETPQRQMVLVAAQHCEYLEMVRVNTTLLDYLPGWLVLR